jgi:hypothetical protein
MSRSRPKWTKALYDAAFDAVSELRYLRLTRRGYDRELDAQLARVEEILKHDRTLLVSREARVAEHGLRLTPIERRALERLAKPGRVDLSDVHGNTIDALMGKKLIEWKASRRGPRPVLTPLGRTTVCVPDVFDDLPEGRRAAS